MEATQKMRLTIAAVAIGLLASTAGAQYKNDAPKTAPPSGPQKLQTAIAAQEPLESAKRINRADAIKLVQSGKAVWIDVRPKSDYDLGHIKGAINIPLTELPQRWVDLPVKKTLITYCA
jgi:3-mercaptopyruvate sulfurtransferase SseA